MKPPTKGISVSIITETPQNDTFSQSQSVACKIGAVAPDAVFCTFALQGNKKIPYKRSGQGVARDTDPSDLYNSEDVWTMEQAPHGQYLGLVQQRPIISASGNYLVCLDVDMKHASGPTNVAIQRMAKYVKQKKMLTEVSVSGRGRHVFLWVQPPKESDLVLPKYKLGGGQELEVFGLPNSAGKSVLLSGNAVVGEFQEAVNLHELLMDWGIIEQHQLQEPKTQVVATKPFDFTQMLSKGAPDEMAKAAQALQYISPDCDYDQWIEIGQALHSEFGEQGCSLWDTWSQSGSKYEGTKDIEVHWKSFHQGKGVGIGTLFKHAKDCGWEAPTKQAERKSAVEDFAAVISQAQGDVPVATDAPEVKGWPERTLTIGQIKPIRYMVKGFWAHSFMVLAGQPGIGKTTAVISLCMVMAGLKAKDCELTSTKKRKTIIVTEDSDQVERTLTGYARHYGISASDLSQWFVIIDAKRSNVKDLLMLAHNVIHHTIDNVRPLLVLDTANATMDIDNENDNSEVGAYIAALKQTIYIQLDTPVCIITHTNKTISKSDSDATARGASAFTGDATLTGVLFEDETKTRYMRLVKTRYQPNFREIKFNSDVFADTVLDEDGDIQEQMVLLVVPAMSSEEDRRQAANDRQSDKRQQQVQDAADAACNFVQSIINAKGSVIMRRGSGRPTVPKELQSMHQLEWADIYQAVPMADQSYARKAVSAAIFQRFAMDQASSGWVQIK
jgi:hypothetical protein